MGLGIQTVHFLNVARYPLCVDSVVYLSIEGGRHK